MQKIMEKEDLSPETERVLQELTAIQTLKEKLERQLNAAGKCNISILFALYHTLLSSFPTTLLS